MTKVFIASLALLFGLLYTDFCSHLAVDDAPGISPFDQLRIQIQKNFSFKSTPEARELDLIIRRAIDLANPKHQGLNDSAIRDLNKNLVQVSQCYGIDPVIFTALIWRESNFKPGAASERGAVGLTQMTLPAIHEVLDRINLNSRRRLGHLRRLVKKCTPDLYLRIPLEISADTLAAWKNSVMLSPRDALVMGALLLKINLAQTSHLHSQVLTWRLALEKYNGDPRVKTQFAVDVLQLSKRMTDFPEISANDSRFLSSIQSP